jgi:hypothetical protein
MSIKSDCIIVVDMVELHVSTKFQIKSMQFEATIFVARFLRAFELA